MQSEKIQNALSQGKAGLSELFEELFKRIEKLEKAK
jgi:hypothetical protein